MAFSGSDYKKFPLSRDLADRLSTRLKQLSSPMVVVQSQDAYGNPVLTLEVSGSAWATGAQYAVLRFLPVIAQINTDAFGNTQTVYAPYRCQINAEGNTTGTGAVPAASDVVLVLGFQLLLNIYAEVVKDGVLVEVWNSGHGTEPAVSSATAMTGSVVATLYPELFGMINAAV